MGGLVATAIGSMFRTTRKDEIMYTDINFKTKKALKQAVAEGKRVTYHQPGPFGGNEQTSGTFCCEGPHYPQPHRWYAECTAENGVIVKVK